MSKYIEKIAPRLGMTLPPLRWKLDSGAFFLNEKMARLVVRYAIAIKKTDVVINKVRFPMIAAISAVTAWIMIAK